jgi:hypothetical protein
VPLRPNIGVFTQPISFVGLPVVAVPVPRAATAGAGVMDVDLPDVRAEVEAAFARYDATLVANYIATLTALFWDDTSADVHPAPQRDTFISSVDNYDCQTF